MSGSRAKAYRAAVRGAMASDLGVVERLDLARAAGDAVRARPARDRHLYRASGLPLVEVRVKHSRRAAYICKVPKGSRLHRRATSR